MPTLNWIGKDAVVNHHQQVPFHLLKDVPELACGEPGDGNLIVQGDNLVALKALLPYYAGQVKCIYIDPPYNTGNENWVYNDNVNSPLIREWLGKVVGKGLFLEKTWRLHPKICDFTSEVFYEGRLEARNGLDRQRIEGHPWLKTPGLWFLPVGHEGNANASPEEVELIGAIYSELLQPGVTWVGDDGQSRPLTPKDILIVAPYNAQVADLSNRLPAARVGTVDKFQGQEAPVVIYSLTTSSPEDAPRGMEFLYSLNRLNVATSRAKAVVILVGSPRLLEPECRSPRQMQLANALCRYVELAQVVCKQSD